MIWSNDCKEEVLLTLSVKGVKRAFYFLLPISCLKGIIFIRGGSIASMSLSGSPRTKNMLIGSG
jgi:hypothetical protein